MARRFVDVVAFTADGELEVAGLRLGRGVVRDLAELGERKGDAAVAAELERYVARAEHCAALRSKVEAEIAAAREGGNVRRAEALERLLGGE